ncbi:prephenate dehydrogenase/arogenate dehydrogenase family protein [Gemmatimonas aurantiaca]|nr:prephenate dehydrogenase/arogenate dehydrogenase family protein [Gemmatimonas aurantiaca]
MPSKRQNSLLQKRPRRKKPTTPVTPSCVGIYGIGLIGGSIAERLRTGNKKLNIIGSDIPVVLRKAKRLSLIDEGTGLPEKMLTSTSLIILAASPSVNKRLLRSLSQRKCDTEALIIDTGSVLSSISDFAKSLNWKNNATFVSAHPMAGRELSGLENRQSNLFESHPFFFDDSVSLSSHDLALIDWLNASLGSYSLFVDSAHHDQVMTDISHLPQIVSTVIGSFLRNHTAETLGLAGTGLQSMIRLGGSPYPLWRDVFKENRENILARLDVLIEDLQSAREEIANGGSKMSPRFKRAQRSYQCLW